MPISSAVTPTPSLPISPSEILLLILEEAISPVIVPGGVCVGPATHEQQQAGCISITDAGNVKIDPYTPVMWARCQLRCLARAASDVDKIGYHAYQVVMPGNRPLHRVEVTLNTGLRYLVHSVMVTSGPSSHFDSQVTWEGLMFVQVMVGLDPIPSA